MSGPPRIACALLLAAAGVTGAWAQSGIYLCTDAAGRKLTSDRPIPACNDREQKELNPSGTVRRVIPPAPTAGELALREKAKREADEEALRRREQRRLENLLVTRYPDQATHDVARARALRAVQGSIASAEVRVAELREQRKALDAEAEFYPPPLKWPDKLQRQYAENEEQAAAQQRFIASQEDEKQRIGTRFDTELARLRVLWAGPAATTAALGADAR